MFTALRFKTMSDKIAPIIKGMYAMASDVSGFVLSSTIFRVTVAPTL